MAILKKVSPTPSYPGLTKAKGSVKWFNDAKGFGFLSPDDAPSGSPSDVFVHYSAVTDQQGRRTLLEGQRVAFTLITGPKGPQAFDVEVL